MDDRILVAAAQWGSEQAQQTTHEQIYETIVKWDEGGGKRSRRELARRIEALLAQQTTEPGLPEAVAYTHQGEIEYVEAGGHAGSFYGAKNNPDLKDAPDFVGLYTDTQMHEHFQAGVRAGMAQSQDAKRLRELLRPYFGYAPGSYMCKCRTCEKTDEWVDKRASTCKECADAAIDAAMQGEQQ